MPGLPLLFTDTGATLELVYKPLPGLYLGEDTFLGEGIWLDQGVAEAFAEQPFLEHEGIVYSVTTTPAEATMPMPGLPTFGEIVEIVDTVPAVATMAMPQFGGQDFVYAPGVPVPAVATMPMPGTSGGIQVILVPSVRELPPLRISHLIETPSGRFFRWGADETNPANVRRRTVLRHDARRVRNFRRDVAEEDGRGGTGPRAVVDLDDPRCRRRHCVAGED